MRVANIAVVNDDPDLLEICQMVLESAGHHVETMTSGRRALERLRGQPVDLVLLDVVMPDLDGAAVLGLLRADPLTRAIPVVLMSALVGAREIAQQERANAFLPKPFDADTLLATVARVLQDSRASTGASHRAPEP
jgi:two-component system cell cycle response regulator